MFCCAPFTIHGSVKNVINNYGQQNQGFISFAPTKYRIADSEFLVKKLILSFLVTQQTDKNTNFMIAVKFVQSRRHGNTLLSVDGFTFSCQKKMGSRKRWRCSTHVGKKCRAIIHTYDDEIIKIKNIHNHSLNET